MAKLTKRRIEAIANALNFYLAGEPNDGDTLDRADYEAARDWAAARLEKRTSEKPLTKASTSHA